MSLKKTLIPNTEHGALQGPVEVNNSSLQQHKQYKQEFTEKVQII